MESFIPKRCSRTVIPPTQSAFAAARQTRAWPRSEEHTSELQSQSNLVCRLLLEKKIYIRGTSGSSHTREERQRGHAFATVRHLAAIVHQKTGTASEIVDPYAVLPTQLASPVHKAR